MQGEVLNAESEIIQSEYVPDDTDNVSSESSNTDGTDEVSDAGDTSEPDDGSQPEVPDNLPGHVKTVKTFAELKSALEDTTTTEIYLAADITMLGGITVNKQKKSLLISGENPYDETIIRRTLTDYASSDLGLVIIVTGDSDLTSLTLANMNIIGKNFYGTVTVRDEKRNLQLIYDDIIYRGPQLTYHRRGTSVYRNCDITIGKYDGTSDANELGEVADVIFEGKVSVKQATSQVNEILYFPLQGGSVLFRSGAQVVVETYRESGFIFIGGAYQVDIELETHASFSYYGKERFWENVAVNNVTVGNGASMYVEIDGTLRTDVLRIRGNLYVGNDAKFHVINKQAASYPVLQMNGGSITFDEPASVLLYHVSRRPIEFMQAGTMTITAGQANTWHAAGDGLFADTPLYHWTKSDGSSLQIKGTVGIGSAGTLSNVQTNFDPAVDDSAAAAPSSSTLNLTAQRVFSVGDLPLEAYYERLKPGIKLFGATKSGALVRATRPEGLQIGQNQSASSIGYYEIIDTAVLEEGTVLTVQAVWNYLRANDNLLYVAGELSLSLEPENIDFGTVILSPDTVLAQRLPEDFTITVTDSRGAGGNWTLQLAQLIPLTPTEQIAAAYPSLNDILVYIDDSGNVYYLDDGPVTIKRHATTNPVDTTTIVWGAEQGLLAQVVPGSVYTGFSYEGRLLWTLIDAP